MNSDSPPWKIEKKMTSQIATSIPPQKKPCREAPQAPSKRRRKRCRRDKRLARPDVKSHEISKPVFQAMFLYGLGDLLLVGELLVVVMIQDWRRLLRCFHWKLCTNAFHICLDVLVNLGYWRVSTIRIRPEQFDPQTPGRLAYWMEYSQVGHFSLNPLVRGIPLTNHAKPCEARELWSNTFEDPCQIGGWWRMPTKKKELFFGLVPKRNPNNAGVFYAGRCCGDQCLWPLLEQIMQNWDWHNKNSKNDWFTDSAYLRVDSSVVNVINHKALFWW